MADDESRADRRDLFVSFTQHDRCWAEWIAWQLYKAGYTVVYQHWDMPPGSNFMDEIGRALSRCRLVAVLSPEYAEEDFSSMEYMAMLSKDPKGRKRLIVGVRIAAGDLPPLMGAMVHCDLVNVANEADARKKLLAAVAAAEGDRPKPKIAPNWPGKNRDDISGGLGAQPPGPQQINERHHDGDHAGEAAGLRRFDLLAAPPFPKERRSRIWWLPLAAVVLLMVGGIGWGLGWFNLWGSANNGERTATALSRSEELTTAACDQYENGKEIIDEGKEPKDRARAIPYLEEAIRIATINIEDNSAQATDMQQRLESSSVSLPEEGQVPEDIKQLIHKNWAVNDVSTCLYIKGRSLELLATKIDAPQTSSNENEERLKEARAAYQAAAALTFGRCWDPRGWFWCPPKLASDRLKVLDKNAPK